MVGIFALSLTAGEAVGRLGTFLWFGLGFGLPLLALSLLSGATQRWITTQFTRRARLINVIAGLLLLLLLLLVVIGLYDLWTNRELIGTFLA